MSLLVSLSDRGSKHEQVVIKGKDMQEVWKKFLTPQLPMNVRLEMVGNPIRRVYELLGAASEAGGDEIFALYSDPLDINERFPIEKQKKYFGNLLLADRIKFIGIERVGDLDVSGTQARKLLSQGLRDEFIQLLPIEVDGAGIWDYLSQRSFIGERG